nr:MAG TPA: hypothetical protein [Caudoviricetes sp.]
MRLIDADEVILHLNDFMLQQSPIDAQDIESINVSAVIQDCIKVVEQQPTAYDIDEVIAQFDEKIEELDREEQSYYAKEDFKNAAELSKKIATVYGDRIIAKKGIKSEA